MPATTPIDQCPYVALCKHCKQVMGAIEVNGRGQREILASWTESDYEIVRLTPEELRAAIWLHKDNCYTKRPP